MLREQAFVAAPVDVCMPDFLLEDCIFQSLEFSEPRIESSLSVGLSKYLTSMMTVVKMVMLMMMAVMVLMRW